MLLRHALAADSLGTIIPLCRRKHLEAAKSAPPCAAAAHPVIREAARKGFALLHHLLEQVLLVEEHEDGRVLEDWVLHHLVEQLQPLVHSDWLEAGREDTARRAVDGTSMSVSRQDKSRRARGRGGG